MWCIYLCIEEIVSGSGAHDPGAGVSGLLDKRPAAAAGDGEPLNKRSRYVYIISSYRNIAVMMQYSVFRRPLVLVVYMFTGCFKKKHSHALTLCNTRDIHVQYRAQSSMY